MLSTSLALLSLPRSLLLSYCSLQLLHRLDLEHYVGIPWKYSKCVMQCNNTLYPVLLCFEQSDKSLENLILILEEREMKSLITVLWLYLNLQIVP